MTFAMSTHRIHDIAGSTMSVFEFGRGPALVLGHGYLWNWRMWRPQIEALRERYRVIVPEMWGHGSSGPLPDGTSSHGDLARHMLELIDRLEIKRFALAGSSMGGMWAAHLAAAAPERVTALALMNTYLGAEPAASREAYLHMLRQVDLAGNVPEPIFQAILPLFFADGASERAPELLRQLRESVEAFDAPSLRHSIVPLGRIIFEREDALHLLPALSVSPLIVAGQNDRSRPPEESAAMAELVGADLHVIGGCGHTATLEQPEAVNRLLLHYLDGVDWSRPVTEPGSRPPLPIVETPQPIARRKTAN